MAFKKKWLSNKVVSTDGYFVQPIGRSSVFYSDADVRVYVGAEWLLGNKWALCSQDMRIGSEEGAQLHDESLRTLIIERIKAAFAFLGWRLDVS